MGFLDIVKDIESHIKQQVDEVTCNVILIQSNDLLEELPPSVHVSEEGLQTLLKTNNLEDSHVMQEFWFNLRLDRVAHTPYTITLAHEMAGFVARVVHDLMRKSKPKVICLDCDNTLWAGAVAEQGSMEVDITPHHYRLQQFFAQMKKEGILLCLCSRNQKQEDVLNVFEKRSKDMCLTMNDLVCIVPGLEFVLIAMLGCLSNKLGSEVYYD